LLKRYSGCPDDAVRKALDALSDIRDYYAYVVVKMAERLRKNCAENLDEAAEEVKSSALRHALEYIWHAVYCRRLDDRQARGAILMVYTIANLRGGFKSGYTLENAMMKAVYSAISRRFYVGKDDLCKRGGDACKLVELLADHIARKVSGEYKSVEEVLAAYVARSVVDALTE